MSEPMQLHSVLVSIQYIEAAAQIFGVQRFSDLDPSMYDMARTVALTLMELDSPPRPTTIALPHRSTSRFSLLVVQSSTTRC